MWRNGNSHALLVRMQIGTTIMENSMKSPQKIKNRITTWPHWGFPDGARGKEPAC